MANVLTDDIRRAIKAQLTAKPEPHRDEKLKHRQKIGGGAKRRGCGASVWPYRSDAMGCNPEQAEQVEATLRQHGCLAQVDRDTGELIMTSQSQYRQAAKAFGMWDGRDGFAVVDTGKQRTQRDRKIAEMRSQLEEL